MLASVSVSAISSNVAMIAGSVFLMMTKESQWDAHRVSDNCFSVYFQFRTLSETLEIVHDVLGLPL